ncbi:MAG TPA: hypothetical protein VGM36_02355 [Rhizomicrobium sp.]|jgi:hypothetical protein
MHSFAKAAVAVFLFVGLSSCSSDSGLFSYDTVPKPAQALVNAEADKPPRDSACADIAAVRADDAVLASYVTEGSSAQQNIYQVTYRECLAERSN